MLYRHWSGATLVRKRTSRGRLSRIPMMDASKQGRYSLCGAKREFCSRFGGDIKDEALGLVRTLHFIFDAMRQFLDLLSLLDHVEREHVFVGPIHELLQFNGQL